MVTFREATIDDMRLLFDWRNEQKTRKSAFNSSALSWKRHSDWLQRKINSLNAYLFILADYESTPVGQVRFDIKGDGSAEIDISIDVNHRGKNYASEGLTKTCSYMKNVKKLKKIFAYVKKENVASCKCFRKAGFENVREVKIKSFDCYLMVYA